MASDSDDFLQNVKDVHSVLSHFGLENLRRYFPANMTMSQFGQLTAKNVERISQDPNEQQTLMMAILRVRYEQNENNDTVIIISI